VARTCRTGWSGGSGSGTILAGLASPGAGPVHDTKAKWIWGVLDELEEKPTWSPWRTRGTRAAPGRRPPYKGKGKPEPQKKQANRAHARLAPASERNAQLKAWRILRKLRCCSCRQSGLFSAVPGLGISTRRAGRRAIPPFPQLGWPADRAARSTPVHLDLGQSGLCRRPERRLLLRTMTHGAPQDVPAEGLVMQARGTSARDRPWPPGKAHAARHGTGSTGTPRPTPKRRGLAMMALTGPLLTTLRTDEAAALPITGGYAVRPAQPVLRPPPTPSRPAVHFPVQPVIRRHAPATLRRSVGCYRVRSALLTGRPFD